MNIDATAFRDSLISAFFLEDFYKFGHVHQYTKNITQVWLNCTPRYSLRPDPKPDSVVLMGTQRLILEVLVKLFNETFFNLDVAGFEAVLSDYRTLFGADASTDHIKRLWLYGRLPINLYALPEGSSVPYGVPAIVMTNTQPWAYWVPNFLETLCSAELWGPCVSATTARQFRRLFTSKAKKWADQRGNPADTTHIPFQGHDFSLRGMFGIAAGVISGLGHLAIFKGTDSVPALFAARRWYGEPLPQGAYVPATEHSVMSAGSKDGEFETFERLLFETYPDAPFLSIVSDTWDLWKVCTDYLPRLKDRILARPGILVIRPDSGDPVEIICGAKGDYIGPLSAPLRGVASLLAECFGTDANGLINKCRIIYGDGINLDRAERILDGLIAKGLSPANVVLGLGSFCVALETPILCSDLIWRKAGDLNPGQEIIAFDENPVFANNRRIARRYKTAFITGNTREVKECARITTGMGDPITASLDHPWLVWSKNRKAGNVFIGVTAKQKRKVPRSAGLVWKTTEQLEAGDKIAFLAKPWQTDDSHSGGWMSGIYDGEGCLSKSSANEARIPAWKINISQNAGGILSRIRQELKNRGFSSYDNPRTCAQVVLTGGFSELLRFLGTVRPQRLLEKLPKMLTDLPGLVKDRTYHLAEVTSVHYLGNNPVASISTSCGTFITGGYLSHNTYQYVTRDTDGWAWKATAVRLIDGTLVPIFKDPVTDDGGKRSCRGIPIVYRGGSQEEGVYESEAFYLQPSVRPEHLDFCAFQKLFADGRFDESKFVTLSEIRARAAEE